MKIYCYVNDRERIELTIHDNESLYFRTSSKWIMSLTEAKELVSQLTTQVKLLEDIGVKE